MLRRSFSISRPHLSLKSAILDSKAISHIENPHFFKDYAQIVSPFYTPLDHDILQFIYKDEPKSILDGGPHFAKIVEDENPSNHSHWKTEKYRLITDVTPGSTEWLVRWAQHLKKFGAMELKPSLVLEDLQTRKSYFTNEKNQIDVSRTYTTAELSALLDALVNEDSLVFKSEVFLYITKNREFFENNLETILQSYIAYLEREVNDSVECNVVLLEFFKSCKKINAKPESLALVDKIIQSFVKNHALEKFDGKTLIGVLDYYIHMGNKEETRLFFMLLVGTGHAPSAKTFSSYISLIQDPVYFTTFGSILKTVSNAEIFEKLLPFVDHFKKLQFLIKSNQHHVDNYTICALSFQKLIDMQYSYETELYKYRHDPVEQKGSPIDYKFLLGETSLIKFNRKVTNTYNLFSKGVYFNPRVLVKVMKAYYKGGNYYMLNKLSGNIKLNHKNLTEIFGLKQSLQSELPFVSGIHKEVFFQKVVKPIYSESSDTEREALAQSIEKYGNKSTAELFNTLVVQKEAEC